MRLREKLMWRLSDLQSGEIMTAGYGTNMVQSDRMDVNFLFANWSGGWDTVIVKESARNCRACVLARSHRCGQGREKEVEV